MVVFNTKLDRAMRDAGFTGKELAVQSGLTESTVSRVLNGHSNPPHGRTVALLCRCLEKQPAELGFGEVRVHGLAMSAGKEV